MKLQPAFDQPDPAQVQALLRRVRLGLLVTQDADGWPQLGWTNAPAYEGGFMLHLSNGDPQAAALRRQPRALLAYSETLATIPSHWVDPRDGGRATNYYLHAEFDVQAELLEGPAAVAALQALMQAYQPEGGYAAPLAEHPQVYGRYYPQLTVARLQVLATRTKWKLGQNLPQPLRLSLIAKLRERGRPEDQRTADEMEAWLADGFKGKKGLRP
jgi:predicted FMN-binding regulatory protein PaiB